MIRQDSYSRILIILALGFSLYLATFTPTTIIILPAILLLGGLVMERRLEKKVETVPDSITSPTTQATILKWTLIALAGIFLMGVFVKMKFPLEITELGMLVAIIFGFIIGISEEQFFRGFILDWLLSKLPSPSLALLSSAMIFTVYHLAVYGTDFDSLMYVFAGGLILSWVAYKSRRISPPMLAHGLNNVYAALQVIRP